MIDHGKRARKAAKRRRKLRERAQRAQRAAADSLPPGTAVFVGAWAEAAREFLLDHGLPCRSHPGGGVEVDLTALPAGCRDTLLAATVGSAAGPLYTATGRRA